MCGAYWRAALIRVTALNQSSMVAVNKPWEKWGKKPTSFFPRKQSHTLILPAMQAYDGSGSELFIHLRLPEAI